MLHLSFEKYFHEIGASRPEEERMSELRQPSVPNAAACVRAVRFNIHTGRHFF